MDPIAFCAVSAIACVIAAMAASAKEEAELLEIFWTSATGFLAFGVVEDIVITGLSFGDIGPIFLVVFFIAFTLKLADYPFSETG